MCALSLRGWGLGDRDWINLLSPSPQSLAPRFKEIENSHQTGAERVLKDSNSCRQAGQHEVKGDGRPQTHGGANEGDTDFGSDHRRLDLFAGADATERGHHSEHRAKQSEKRAALDRRRDPVRTIFEVAHDVALEDFHDHLPKLIVAQLAISHGELNELRQSAG